MRVKTAILLMVFLVGIAIASYYMNENGNLVYDYNYEIEADSHGFVVGTGSMEPMITKEDTLYYRDVSQEEILWLGNVYVYEEGNITVLHRFIGYADEGGEWLIFKGDNNHLVDEPVHRSAVIRELVAICFGGYCNE